MSLPPVGPWMMWVGIGIPAYLFLCFGISKSIAVMGSDEPSTLQQDEELAEISHRAPASWRGR